MTDIYFDTVWDYLSEGLKKRIVAAVRKSKEEGQQGAVVDSLSNEHRDEIEWMAAREDTGQGVPFIALTIGSGSRSRSAIRLTKDMTDYVERRVVGS
jgi:hypothetical protein